MYTNKVIDTLINRLNVVFKHFYEIDDTKNELYLMYKGAIIELMYILNNDFNVKVLMNDDGIYYNAGEYYC